MVNSLNISPFKMANGLNYSTFLHGKWPESIRVVA